VLKTYKFRGNYLNFNVVQHFINGDMIKDNNLLPGFLPVEMDYNLINGESDSLRLTHCESVYLCMNPAPNRHEILENILFSAQGFRSYQKINKPNSRFLLQKNEKNFRNSISWKMNQSCHLVLKTCMISIRSVTREITCCILFKRDILSRIFAYLHPTHIFFRRKKERQIFIKR